MHRSRAEFFRNCVAQCQAAAETAKDPAIKQAYLELMQAWQVLAAEIERLRTQILRREVYSGALPQRSLDDFYELRPAETDRRQARRHAIEHPTLGGSGDASAADRDARSPQSQAGRMRRMKSP
jgi:hypothetical protein